MDHDTHHCKYIMTTTKHDKNENSHAVNVTKQTIARQAMVVSDNTERENLSVQHFFLVFTFQISWIFLDIPG